MYNEDKEKDKILQEIHDVLESQHWGDGNDKVIIKIILRGKFQLSPIEVEQKFYRKVA